jgi:hypothetical protein
MLQLLQRAAYVLVKDVTRNVRKILRFSCLETLFKIALTKFLSILHSKFEMPPIRKMVSLKKMHNFCIGRFLSV